MTGQTGVRMAFHAAALAGLFASPATAAHAHSGGLDKDGCHRNSKTGDYHCHRGTPPATTQRAPAIPPARFAAPVAPQHRQDATPSRIYRNCDEARAHGAAPVRRGDPGYAPHLDRDHDGVGCEPYRGR